MKTINASSLCEDFWSHQALGTWDTGFEKYWHWPKEIGSGFMYMTRLRPGLSLVIGDFQLFADMKFNLGSHTFPIIFCFSISGNMDYSYNAPNRPHNVWEFHSGYAMIAYMPKWQGIAQYPAGHSMRGVCLYVDPSLLHALVSEQNTQIDSRLCSIVNGKKDSPFFQAVGTSPQTHIVLHQIFDCPLQGAMKQMYLESKALELITLSLSRMVPEKIFTLGAICCSHEIEAQILH